nr:toprim domain-containing protein [Roseovarius dicentrarchi]
MLGRLQGNAIRFGKWADCTDLLAGEGLENTLSVGTALPRAALASCLTANHLAAFNYPSSIQRLWIARDNDKTGARAAFCLADRADADGIEPVVLTPERDDFNLDLTTGGVTEMRRRLVALIGTKVSEHDLWPS